MALNDLEPHLSPGFVNASPATRANAVATEELEAALAARPSSMTVRGTHLSYASMDFMVAVRSAGM